VVGTRNEHPACCRFDGNVVRAAVTFDVEFFDLELLRVPDNGHGNARCEQNRKYG
jgi:hypothetical protein